MIINTKNYGIRKCKFRTVYKADKVIWLLTFNVVGNDISAVYSEIDTKTGKVIEFLETGGIDRSEITVSAPLISDKYAQEYGNNDCTFRYLSKNIVTVCTENVDAVLALMTATATPLISRKYG